MIVVPFYFRQLGRILDRLAEGMEELKDIMGGRVNKQYHQIFE